MMSSSLQKTKNSPERESTGFTSSNSHNNLFTAEDSCEYNHIEDVLIEDVLHLILRFLDVPSLKSLRLVSSFWNSFTLPHLNDRIFLSLSKVTLTTLPSSFTSIGGPISTFLLYPSIPLLPYLTYLSLTFSPPTDASINILQKLLASSSTLRNLKLTLFEWGISSVAESNIIKSSPTPQNFYAEFLTLQSLKSLEVCGTLGAYSSYLTASLVKFSPNLTKLSLPQITLQDDSIADRNNARLWLCNWLSSHPEVTRKLTTFTWSPFNLSLPNLTDSQVTNRRNLVKKLHSVPCLQFSNKLKVLKWQIPFYYAEKGTHRHTLLPGIIRKSLHTLCLQDIGYSGSSFEEDSSLNQDQDWNQCINLDISIDHLPNLKYLEVDTHVCENNFISKILAVSPNLVSLKITSDNGCSQYSKSKKSELNGSEILKIFNTGNLTPHLNLQQLEIPFVARTAKEVITLYVKFPSLKKLLIHVKEDNNLVLEDTEVKIDLFSILEYANRFRHLSWLRLIIHCSHRQQVLHVKCEMTSCVSVRSDAFTDTVCCENIWDILKSNTRKIRIHEIVSV